MCGTEECLTTRSHFHLDFRAEQCARYDGQYFPQLVSTQNSGWRPKYAGVNERDRCKLICEQPDGAYITLADRVIDGTRYVCVDMHSR